MLKKMEILLKNLIKMIKKGNRTEKIQKKYVERWAKSLPKI